jgi:hypothetical protein
MKWMRTLAVELFPAWHERRLLRELQAESDAGLDALQRFRRKIAMEDKKQPARDVREAPASNPKGPAPGKVEPTPPVEVPPTDEHVPEMQPERVRKSAADRGAQ